MNTLLWKRLLGKCYLKPDPTSRKLILLYHSVGQTPWGMNAGQFKEQMLFLTEHCEVLSLPALLTSEPTNKIQVAITFDDGYACLHDVAAPIMKELNIPGMVYLNTSWIGESSKERKQSVANLGHYPDEQFLIWDEVKALHQLGWEFGSHGMNHLHFITEADDLVQDELLHSRIAIEHYLEKYCPHFAYTWGEYTSSLQKKVKEAGYDYATAVIHQPLSSKSDPLALPRMNISNDYTLADFKNCIIGKWDFLGLIQRVKRFI